VKSKILEVHSVQSQEGKLTVGSLFSGVGGFELGFEKTGFITKWAIENDPHAAITYRHNFSDHLLIEKDIKSVSSEEIKKLSNIDILLAGFPCQAFSVAGYRKGFKDPRGNLFDEIIRFIEKLQKKPKVLVLENVRNFYGHDGGKTWEYVSDALTLHNYSLVPMILNTSTSTGIPQNRERAYIVCFN
jgi:DNA (cytosine-5)-methyltransferase 1